MEKLTETSNIMTFVYDYFRRIVFLGLIITLGGLGYSSISPLLLSCAGFSTDSSKYNVDEILYCLLRYQIIKLNFAFLDYQKN